MPEVNYELEWNQRHECYDIVETNKPADGENVWSTHFEAIAAKTAMKLIF